MIAKRMMEDILPNHILSTHGPPYLYDFLQTMIASHGWECRYGHHKTAFFIQLDLDRLEQVNR